VDQIIVPKITQFHVFESQLLIIFVFLLSSLTVLFSNLLYAFERYSNMEN